MNTPAHLLLGTSVFGRPDQRGTLGAAFLGAAAPDVSLYVMVIVSIWIMGVPADTVFREYYYSDAWQSVFAVDNSFIFWGILFAVAYWQVWIRLIAFAGAGLLHIALDFPLHSHDARMHFWPVSDWVFVSPVSYWDSAAHAGVVGPMEFFLSLACAAILWQRFREVWVRGAAVGLMVLETASSGIWHFVF